MNKIEDIIEKEGYYISTSVGNSMLPFLRERKDTIVIQKWEQYKKFDVVLYKRKCNYVLHRIIKVLPETFHIRGDNCYYDEYVKHNEIIGVMVECYRGEKKVNLDSLAYKIYVYLRVYLYPIRRIFNKIKSKIKQ
jgi:hypothetical protein